MLSRALALRIVVYALVVAALHLSLAAPEHCDQPDATALRRAAADGARWMAGNQRPDGSFLYLYARGRGDLGGYSLVRHAGVTLSLYQSAAALGSGRLLRAADAGEAWLEQRLASGDDADVPWRAPSEAGRAPLGGAALMLAALVERRSFTSDGSHDDLMCDLGGFIVSLQRPDGGFHTEYDVTLRAADVVSTSRYFPGEATWALARLANTLPDSRWVDAARRGAAFIATRRDRVERVRFPPLNDHWASYAFAEMAAWPVSEAEADYALRLHARFQLLIRSQAQQASGGAYALTHGPPRRGAAVGTWLEGEAALAALARGDGRLAGREEAILDSARCAASLLIDRQIGSEEVAADGAWFAGGETRMDDQQHPVSGLLALARHLDDRRAQSRAAP